MRWKSRGMPGKTHSLPSRRTTGCRVASQYLYRTRRVPARAYMEDTHDPDVRRDVEHLGARGEERHALARGALLLVLLREVWPVLDHLGHAPQCLLVVLERLVERLRERRVGDVCGRSMRYGQRREQEQDGVPSCVGPMPPELITKS